MPPHGTRQDGSSGAGSNHSFLAWSLSRRVSVERVLQAEAANDADAVGRDERHEGDQRGVAKGGAPLCRRRFSGQRVEGRHGGNARLLCLRPREVPALDIGRRVQVLLLDLGVGLVAQVDKLLDRVWFLHVTTYISIFMTKADIFFIYS